MELNVSTLSTVSLAKNGHKERRNVVYSQTGEMTSKSVEIEGSKLCNVMIIIVIE